MAMQVGQGRPLSPHLAHFIPAFGQRRLGEMPWCPEQRGLAASGFPQGRKWHRIQGSEAQGSGKSRRPGRGPNLSTWPSGDPLIPTNYAPTHTSHIPVGSIIRLFSNGADLEQGLSIGHCSKGFSWVKPSSVEDGPTAQAWRSVLTIHFKAEYPTGLIKDSG